MQDIFIPTLLFWENGNTWYGSSGQARFYISPVKREENTLLKVQLWRGPLTKELSEIIGSASFPLSEAGLAELTVWLEEKAARLNG